MRDGRACGCMGPAREREIGGCRALYKGTSKILIGAILTLNGSRVSLVVRISFSDWDTRA